MTDNAITVRGANKRYGDFVALDNVDFDVPAGSLTALLGPSGSGKSTLLRAIAGLDQPDSGTITINGRDVTTVAPQRRGIGFVFQHYAAFKHLTVRDNVAFGLKIRRQAEGRDRREGRPFARGGGPQRISRPVTPVSFPAVSASAWRWRARWRSTRRFCCSTNLSARSTRKSATICGPGCAACTTRCMSPPCWSPTTRPRRWTWQTGSPCSRTGASNRSDRRARSTTPRPTRL